MKTYIIVGIVAGIAIVAGLWTMSTRNVQAPQACTLEAKVCPDGSAVGRTGPNCEFAECPAVATTTSTTSNSVSVQAHMSETVTGLGVSITPLALLEDSRCPTDVQCVQAGTVRLRARLVSGLGTATQEFKLGQLVTTEAENVTLTSVTPQKKSTVTVKDSEYVFTFEITKRATTPGIAPYTSGIRGTVMLGPTCPVERDPPDPQCADKPYATTVVVHRAGSSATFATSKSDAKGAFEFSLPPGNYSLTAAGGTTLPRCNPVDVTVLSSGYVTANISCDTGIR